MAKAVGVFINDAGVAASLYEQGVLRVYHKRQGGWLVAKEMNFGLDQNLNIREMRGRMTDALSFLGDCKIFVARSVVGVPYFELEKEHISVWEFEGKPLEFLDYISQQEAAAEIAVKEQENRVVPLPLETAPGCYQISIKDLQEGNGGVTSKQVLLPFIRKGGFYELTVTCGHIPPWLELELASGNFATVIEKKGEHEIKVIITKKCCEA